MSSQNIIDTPENVAVDDIVIEESYAFANRDVEKWKSETNKKSLKMSLMTPQQ